MNHLRIVLLIAVLVTFEFVSTAHAQTPVQVSTWNPTTGVDNYDDSGNWSPPGVPGLTTEARIEQLGDRTLTPVRFNGDHQALRLKVVDAHVLLRLHSHRYSLLVTNQEAEFASIIVGGSGGPAGAPVLEVHDGTLAGIHAVVGKGMPGQLGPLPNSRPAISIQSDASLVLAETLWVGYGDPSVSKDRPGLMHIAGNAQCDAVFVYPESKLGIINGGSVQIGDKIDVSPGSELRIGNAPEVNYPQSSVTAQFAEFRGSVTIDNGTVTAQQSVDATRGPVLVSRGSGIVAPLGIIAGSSAVPGHVTVTGINSAWSSSDSIFVGGYQDQAAGGGILSIADNASAVAGNLVKVWPNGRVELDNGTIQATNIQVQGTLCGTGTITGNVTSDGGTIDPGCSIGRLHIEGDYNQSADGTLIIDIAGINAGQYDVLGVSGDVELDGGLTINIPSDLTLDPGVTIPVLEADSLSGSFSEISIPSESNAQVLMTSEGVQIKTGDVPTSWVTLFAVVALVVVVFVIYLVRRRP